MRRSRQDSRRRGNAFGSRCSLLCLSIALIVSSALLVSGQRWPVAQDANLRRITVSNDDGDVYVESSGDGSEIVLKTEKVRVDGDVYCGTSNVGLSAHIDALKTKDDALDERIDTLNDTQVELRDDLDTLETSTSGRLSTIDTTLMSLSSVDTSLSATDASLSSRIDTLNATDAQLKATDETLVTRIASLNATDAALKGVDDDLSSRIDALRDIYVNELNVTDKQLIVTDATLGSRIDDLNATQYELKSADAALSSRIATLESAHEEYERIDDEVAGLIASLNATDATMQLQDASLSDRIDVLNTTTASLAVDDASLVDRIASIQPPKCMEPGGAKLRFNGTHWFCMCNQNWSGSSCESSWMREAKLDTSSSAYERFGYSVAAFENTVVVGAPYEGSGNVYVYSLSDDSWTLQEKIESPQGDDYDRFGYAVDIVDDIMTIGAIEDEDNCILHNPGAYSCGTGSVYVFARSGTTWTRQAKLTASDGANGDNFGSAVSISGNDVAVGALVGSGLVGAARPGKVFFFSRTGDTWTETAKIMASGGNPNGFGCSIGISGDDLVVGARGNGAHIFKRTSGTWTERAKVHETQTSAGAFGQAVSISGDTLVVSAPYDDNNGKSGSGSAHVFMRVEDSWTKQATLTAGSDSQTSDQFGYSISISGDLIALGAPGHGADESWMGDASTGPGAVYVFRRTDDTWSKEAKLMIGTDAGSYDSLGKAVSINTNGTVFAGAPPSNGGSVYVFSFKA